MRLVVHNMLQCHVKGCNSNNFPLRLFDVELEIHEIEFNPQFLQSLLPKLDWNAFISTANQIGITSLPQTLPEEIDEDFLKNLHRILFEIAEVPTFVQYVLFIALGSAVWVVVSEAAAWAVVVLQTEIWSSSSGSSSDGLFCHFGGD
ncbi:37769_t:CDS:2, partial [Gigaspora margarita]